MYGDSTRVPSPFVEPRQGTGIAAIEAPRGTLIHCYHFDSRGVCTAADIITPTAINQAAMERDLFTAAQELDGAEDAELVRHRKYSFVRTTRASRAPSTSLIPGTAPNRFPQAGRRASCSRRRRDAISRGGNGGSLSALPDPLCTSDALRREFLLRVDDYWNSLHETYLRRGDVCPVRKGFHPRCHRLSQ